MSKRFTPDDLRKAADWLDAYDGAPGENINGMRFVAAFLVDEAERRERAASDRELWRKVAERLGRAPTATEKARMRARLLESVANA